MFRRTISIPLLAALALTGLVPVASAAPAPATAAAAPTKKPKKGELQIDLPIQEFQLANGLKVYVLEDHSSPTFSVQIAYHVGARDEETGRTGFAHLFEHMMFKGSKNVPDGGHFRYVLGVGGQMNAFTSSDVTQYFDVLPSNYLDMALWLEADRMRSLEVTDKNFENQRDAVKEEKGMRVDNAPYAGAILDFMASVWTGTGYGHPVIGSLADLDAAQTKDVQAFFDRYYTPNNAVMAIVGDVDLAEVQAKVEKYFGDIPRGADRAPFPAVDHKQTKVEEVKEDALARQPLYLMGWKTVPEHHADAPALELLMNVLLRGDSSRITKILKDEKKLVIASLPLGGFGGGRDAGMAAAAFIPVEGKAFEDIKAVVVEQVAQLKKKGITPKELRKLVAQVTVDTVESLSTNNGRAGMMANDGLFYGDPKHVLTQLEKYRAVTAADIKRVANQYLTENWLVLQVVPKAK